MNYLAHGYRFVEDPYRLAGTALPDWLAASDRRARLRRDRVRGGHDGLRAGVEQHWADDDRFHATEAFQSLEAELTSRIRAAHPAEPRLRAWFLGHVLVEMLLDAHLIGESPRLLDRYYAALDAVDAAHIEENARLWATRPPVGLRLYIDAFRRTRYLRGYLDDEGLFHRLARVAERVGLPPLPPTITSLLPDARRLVAGRADDLLSHAPGTTPPRPPR